MCIVWMPELPIAYSKVKWKGNDHQENLETDGRTTQVIRCLFFEIGGGKRGTVKNGNDDPR